MVAINKPVQGELFWATKLNTVLDTLNGAIDAANVTIAAAQAAGVVNANAIALKAPIASPAFTGTPTGITKTHVGLANVDNVSDALQPQLIRGDAGKNYRMVSCVLQRVSGSVWAVFDDAGHAPTGVSSVSITSTYVQVNYSFTATKVSSWQNTVDEAFAAAGSGGVRCGTSVGTTYTRIFFYIGTSSTPVDPGTLSTAGANVWVTGIMEV